MKKVVGAGLAVLVILLGLPFAAAMVVAMGVGAATECATQAVQPITATVPIEGPVGGPVTGNIVVAQANIPQRVEMAGFNASMPRVLSTRPDFVSLNEMAGRSLAQIEAAAPGYAAYREPDAVPGSSARESISNVVAWRTDTWTRVGGGRVTIVEGDRGFYDGHPILWDCFVTWTMLQRADGAVVSMLSVHHMINPHKFPRQHGNPPLTRAEQYGQGMDTLIGLTTSLAAHGPVLLAGDLNTHATYTDLPWSAVSKMSAAGYGWHSAAVDFIFFQRELGVTLTQGWSGPMQSDHPWIAAKFAMNSVGPTSGPAAGGDLAAVTPPSTSTGECSPPGAGVTVASFNLLGAGHTDKSGGGGETRDGFPSWKKRLPGAMAGLESAGVSIAALQEVHPPQAKALAGDYAASWGMFPLDGDAQNRVIWDSTAWTLTTAQLVQIPYFGGTEVGMPLVQLTSTTAGQSIWVWSIHNPADARGNASGLRAEALRRQHATLSDVAAAGTPVVIAGDFNDARDGNGSSHCQLTPTLTNAFGGSADPCTKPTEDAAVDHIYGANLSWASARVDSSVQSQKVSDHPLVVATTVNNSTACTMETAGYNLGPVKPELARLVGILGPMFAIQTVGGYRESAHDPNGHPSGRAADFMVPLTAGGKQQGAALAEYARSNAGQLGVDYIIWYQRIWSTDRAGEGWRPMEDRGSDTENHRDHVHINVFPSASVDTVSAATQGCSEGVYPVPEQYVGSDQHNWHSEGSRWSSWHTGTDFSMPCGTPVYAAHAGTVEIDTTQSWAGPYLVKITTGPTSLATWYAHMETVTVSRAQTVTAGDQIGTTGDLGNARGCHLHFEVHLENGSIYGPDNVNPSDWLTEHAQGAVTARTARRDIGGQEAHNHAA